MIPDEEISKTDYPIYLFFLKPLVFGYEFTSWEDGWRLVLDKSRVLTDKPRGVGTGDRLDRCREKYRIVVATSEGVESEGMSFNWYGGYPRCKK